MTSCVATTIWCQHFLRALNGGSPTLWSQWLLLITSRAIRRGNFVNIRKSNKIIQPLAPHSKLSPHLHSLGCSQSSSTPYRDSPPVLFVPHCHSPSVGFTCTLRPHSHPLIFHVNFPPWRSDTNFYFMIGSGLRKAEIHRQITKYIAFSTLWCILSYFLCFVQESSENHTNFNIMICPGALSIGFRTVLARSRSKS